MVGGSHGGTKWIPFPLPPLSAWRAVSRPSIKTGPILADASCILALFRLSYFISQNFHMSHPQSQGLSRRHFHHPRGLWGWWWRGGRGVLKEPVGWATMIWPSLGHGQSTSAWLLKLLMEAKSPGHSKSQLPSPALGEVKGGSPNGYNRTLKESGHLHLLLDAGWFWFRKSWLQPSQKTEDLETKDKKMKLKRNTGPPSVPQSATKEGKKSTQACSLHQVTLLSGFKVQAHWSHVKNRSHQWARMCVQVCVCVVCVRVRVSPISSVLTSLLHCISSSCLKPGYHMEEMVRNRTEAGTRTAHLETP